MILLAHSYFLRDDPKQLARMKPYAPLATLLAAALLREHGHRVSLFDAMLAGSMEEFDAALAGTRPAVVGILEDNFNFLTKMCTVRMREATLQMVGAAREAGCRIVVNGSDSTDNPQLYLQAGADAVLLGDGDLAMLAVADALRANATAPLRDIGGLALRDGSGALVRTPAPSAARNLDALPFPAWDLVDVDDTAARGRRRMGDSHGTWSRPVAVPSAATGAQSRCSVAAIPSAPRNRSPRKCGSSRRQSRRITSGSPTTSSASRHSGSNDFADAVEKLDARIPFMIQCRADLLQPRVAAALARAGAEEVWIGVESGSQKILDAMDKGTTVQQVRDATCALKEHRNPRLLVPAARISVGNVGRRVADPRPRPRGATR